MLSMLDSNVATMQEAYKASGMTDTETLQYMKDGMEVIGMMPPIQIVFVFMMQNLLIGFLLSLPIAWFCKKKHAQLSN